MSGRKDCHEFRFPIVRIVINVSKATSLIGIVKIVQHCPTLSKLLSQEKSIHSTSSLHKQREEKKEKSNPAWKSNWELKRGTNLVNSISGMKDIVPTYCVSLYCYYKKYLRVYLNVKVVNQNTILGKALKKKKLLKSWDQKLSKIVKNSKTHREKNQKLSKLSKIVSGHFSSSLWSNVSKVTSL